MSCRVEVIGDCGDISGLGRALFFADKEDASWLNSCQVSLSSCGSLLAVSHKSRLCLLTAQWINSTESNVYLISWNGTLPYEVSALLAVPICPTTQSSQSGPDWLCIIVGFKNGSVGFYTNAGHLLLLEKLDEKPVLKISAHTGSFGTEPDDVHILFPTAVCILTGSSLFQTLRFAKAQLARVHAGLQQDFSLDGRNIGVRKWTFTDQDVVSDAAVVGLELKNTYDHLLAASSYAGYNAWYRSVAPHNTLVVGAGARPYLGLHYALEGGAAPPLAHVARALATKIKSALPGWLSGAPQEPASAGSDSSRVRAEPLALRSWLADGQRAGAALALSPCRRLAAVADSLGRVALLDTRAGHVVRLFKGYRDAQCAFVQVFEHDSKRSQQLVNIKNVRRAIFLVIYNPKKGIIDIRLMQRGNRVAAFTATKNGKLIYNTHGLLGTETGYTQKKLNIPTCQCVLMDPDGKLKKFVIPFFYALEGENSQRSKDVHLVRDLREFVKQGSDNKQEFKEELLRRIGDIKTLDLKKHCLDMLINNDDVESDALIECLKLYLNFYSDVSKLDPLEVKFRNHCSLLLRLTLFYVSISSRNLDEFVIRETPIGKNEVPDKDTKSNTMEAETIPEEKANVDITKEKMFKEHTEIDKQKFHLSDRDTEMLSRLLDLSKESDFKEVHHAKVNFADTKVNSYRDFVHSFDLEQNQEEIKLKTDLPTDQAQSLAKIIFKPIFSDNNLNLRDLSLVVRESNLNTKDLVKLVIMYWMELPLSALDLNGIDKFIEILYYLTQSSEEANDMSYNELSPWWQDVRDMLIDMPCPLRSMIVAMVCRVVSQIIEENGNTEGEDAWVSVTKENAKWSILIGKLEDISLLSIILLIKETYKGESLPKIKSGSFDINLKFIYSRGKGSVSELIARWLCSMGVIPEAIVVNELKTENIGCKGESADDNQTELFLENYQVYVDENPRIFKWFNLLRKQFPYSSKSDNVIANMGWEYAVTWQKDIKDISMLEAAITCVNNISDPHLAVGLSCLIWNTHIRETFEHACRLTNKVGKLPKERLCLQDVGLTETKLIKFLKLVTEFLENFLAGSTNTVYAERTKSNYEKIWDESIPALVDVAKESSDVNQEILNVIHQIACVMYYQCNFNIKTSKPLSTLFDCDLQLVLNGLTSKNVDEALMNIKSIEIKLKGARTKFLNKLVVASVELITSEEQEGETVYQTAEALDWMNKLYALADLWSLDSDILKRQQVLSLYVAGCERLCRAVALEVREPGAMLPALLRAVRARVRLALELPRAHVLAALPPDLLSRLHDQEQDGGDEEEWLSNCSWDTCAWLLEQAVAGPPAPPAPLRRHANDALEAISVMQQLA